MNTQDLKALIRNVPDFPKPGIIYRDITTLLQSPAGFHAVIQTFLDRYQNKDFQIEAIAGIESRGFIYASVCAHALQLPLILIRKKGKLP
ncbi:MAG TPA: adenine phosphoribosyltransferase, partial [Gammaproteobacteria bacterium]|nr:adenine phosphoribosyltransferase [Gammaproteobacteria bacterium]